MFKKQNPDSARQPLHAPDSKYALAVSLAYGKILSYLYEYITLTLSIRRIAVSASGLFPGLTKSTPPRVVTFAIRSPFALLLAQFPQGCLCV